MKPNIDLDMLTVPELTALIKAAGAKRDAKMSEAKASLLAEFEARSAELGMSFDELRAPTGSQSGRKPRKDAGTPVAPKFRGPNGETWTGRGRKPGWLTVLESQGKMAADYRI
ncbi:H-NS family nucleoid-associated regulatory protein [Falsiroseomonas sp. HC035]|uniref:H-NS histone family protein n=1 Tax=Falsiroseomonas sp. HC035 TaxID=3390999 RepID=UPI003D312333